MTLCQGQRLEAGAEDMRNKAITLKLRVQSHWVEKWQHLSKSETETCTHRFIENYRPPALLTFRATFNISFSTAHEHTFSQSLTSGCGYDLGDTPAPFNQPEY